MGVKKGKRAAPLPEHSRRRCEALFEAGGGTQFTQSFSRAGGRDLPNARNPPIARTKIATIG
jgi:hypothetical protein